MKRTTVFLLLYLGFIYFMLGAFFCYELGKTHSIAASFAGMWDAIQALIPIFVCAGIAILSDVWEKRKNKVL